MRFHHLLSIALIAAMCLLNLIPSVEARLTPEQKAEMRRNAEKADKEINFVNPNRIKDFISSGTSVVLFGANWCIFTQEFTPKWLEVQKNVENLSLDKMGLNFGKVECNDPNLHKGVIPQCSEDYGIDSFPTVILFKDGKLIEEYEGANEVETLTNYVKELVGSSSIKTTSPNISELEAGGVDSSSLSPAHKASIASPLAILGFAAIGVTAFVLYKRRKTQREGYYQI